MALTGRMRDFGISEILQLIGHQKKSGVLEVRDKTRKVEIMFDQGGIVNATIEPGEDRYDLGAMLVRSGLISPSQMEMARKEQQQSLEPLEQILVKSKALESKELQSMVRLCHLEIINSLFLWKDGNYSFEAGSVSYPQQWVRPISSEGVLMDGYRIKDEWPLIEKVIPQTRVILESTGEDGPGITREAQKVLRLIDGSRTAEDLVFLSRMGTFETLKLIKELIDKGNVRIAGEVEGPVLRDAQAITLQAAAGVILALGLLTVVMGIKGTLERTRNPDVADPGVAASESLKAMYLEDRVGTALDIYALKKGRYPESLAGLLQSGPIEEKDFETAWGKLEYRVERDMNSCRLSLPGAVSPKPEVREPEAGSVPEAGSPKPEVREPEAGDDTGTVNGDNQTNNP